MNETLLVIFMFENGSFIAEKLKFALEHGNFVVEKRKLGNIEHL